MRGGLTLRTLAILHDRLLKGEKRRWVCKPCVARKNAAEPARIAAAHAAVRKATEVPTKAVDEPAPPKKRKTA
jgi:hypothetical protein